MSGDPQNPQDQDCDHEWDLEEYDNGDPSTPYFESGSYLICRKCEATQADDSGPDEPSMSDFI